MKFSEIKNLDDSELIKKTLEAKAELIQLRLKNDMGRLEKPLMIRLKRREIARLMTAISQKKKKT